MFRRTPRLTWFAASLADSRSTLSPRGHGRAISGPPARTLSLPLPELERLFLADHRDLRLDQDDQAAPQLREALSAEEVLQDGDLHGEGHARLGLALFEVLETADQHRAAVRDGHGRADLLDRD